MSPQRWLALVLLFTLLVAPLPALAEANNVLRIDGGDLQNPKELPRLLSEEEVAKIQRLQRAVRWSIASPVSPDDRRVLVLNSAGDVGLLNVVDGTSLAISLAALGPLMPLRLLSPSAEGCQWLDPSVLVTLAVNRAAEGPADALQVLSLNVDTGEVRSKPLGLGENAVPVSLSPDGRTVLIYETELRPDAGGLFSLAAPFSASLPLSLATGISVALPMRTFSRSSPYP